MTLEIVTRQEWNAAPPTRIAFTNASEAFVHHTVGSRSDPYSYMRSMQDWHMNGRDPRMWDIAYNHVVDFKSMTVFEGRGFGVRPAGQKNHNDNTWAVAVIGNYSTGQSVATQDEIDLILELIAEGQAQGHLPQGIPIRGHYEVQDKNCPGANMVAWLPYLNGNGNQPINKEEEDMKEVFARLQAVLIRAGYDLGTYTPYLPAGDPDSLDGADGMPGQKWRDAWDQAFADEGGSGLSRADVIALIESADITVG